MGYFMPVTLAGVRAGQVPGSGGSPVVPLRHKPRGAGVLPALGAEGVFCTEVRENVFVYI